MILLLLLLWVAGWLIVAYCIAKQIVKTSNKPRYDDNKKR